MPAEKVEKKSTKSSKASKDATAVKPEIKKKSKDFVAQNFRNAIRDLLALPSKNETTGEHDKLQLNGLTCKLAAKGMQDYIQRLAVRAANSADERDKNTIQPEDIIDATQIEPAAFPKYLIDGVAAPVRKTREEREKEREKEKAEAAKAGITKAPRKNKKQAMEVSA